jgi:ankyrin repeat protein
MSLPRLPNEMFIAIAEQVPDLNTILTMMTSNRTLSTLLAPVLLRNAAESGALVNGNTVLGDALSRGNLELVDAMLSASTLRIDTNNIDNWTLLATAIRDKHMGMIELLLAHGADANAQGAHHFAATFLELALDLVPEPARATYADRIFKIFMRYMTHTTPLALAVLAGQRDFIPMLVAKGADV